MTIQTFLNYHFVSVLPFAVAFFVALFCYATLQTTGRGRDVGRSVGVLNAALCLIGSLLGVGFGLMGETLHTSTVVQALLIMVVVSASFSSLLTYVSRRG